MSRFAKFGIEIRPVRSHIEAEELINILPALDGQTGKVTVVDRASGMVTIEGTADEVRRAIILLARCHSGTDELQSLVES
jgi:hypothetical protein